MTAILRATVLGSLVLAWTVAADPSLEVDTDSVAVSGLEPGGGAVLAGVSRQLDGWITEVRDDRRLAVDEDGDGRVRFELTDGAPTAAVWVVVDTVSGDATVAASDGLELQPLDTGLLVDGSAEDGDVLRLEGRLFEVVLVQPTAAGGPPKVWSQTLSNGGPTDRDPDPAAMGLALSDLVPLEDGAESSPGAGPVSPERLGEADVIVLLDPQRLRAQVVRPGDADGPTAGGK